MHIIYNVHTVGALLLLSIDIYDIIMNPMWIKPVNIDILHYYLNRFIRYTPKSYYNYNYWLENLLWLLRHSGNDSITNSKAPFKVFDKKYLLERAKS